MQPERQALVELFCKEGREHYGDEVNHNLEGRDQKIEVVFDRSLD
jgi:hypothetical protein